MTKVKIALLTVLIVAVVGGVGGVGFYFYNQYQHARTLLKNPEAAAKEEINTLVDKVSKHILLPTGELPQIAKVTNADQLKSNSFFALTQAGDVVLIYTQAQKAILFRPSIDKVIEMAPATPPSQVAGESTASAQLATAKLAIYNSTSTPGLTSVVSKNLEQQITQVQTTVKSNSKKDNYEKTLVVVLKPGAQALGTKLAEAVKAEITDKMPEGEDMPETDLLLILGTDYKP